MNSNAATLIDLARMEILNTVLLDNIDRGAADPWGVAWSADSATLVITHAGTHEISVIDFPALLARLAKVPAALDPSKPADPISASRVQADVPNDLAFLVGVRQRIKLPPGDLGPRAVVLLGRKAYVANYFSDSLSLVDLASPQPRPQSIPLYSNPAGADAQHPASPLDRMPLTRKGEFYFNDAGICFQGWQSCATCHPGQARADGAQLGPAQRRHRQPQEYQEPVAGAQDAARHEHGRARHGGDGGPRRHPAYPVHRAAGRGRRGH